ncbi:hypothetical protein C8J56DRAFT_452707 [Mycena floridula]|nr:hypothetical protein C8J56DRAFT_452707 [Mycena floridula]
MSVNGVLPLNLMKIPVTVMHCVAIGATIFRVSFRAKRKNFWWDDGLAAIAMMLDVMYLITFWFRNPKAGVSPPNILRLYIILNWFHLMLGTTILWMARISIMVGINRIVLPWGRLRTIAMIMPFVFTAMWIVVMSQKIWVCTRDESWHHSPSVQCFLSLPIPYIELSVDLVADFILCVVPACLLWNVGIEQPTRRLLISTFMTSIGTSLANIVYIAFMFGSMEWKTFLMVAVSAHIEATISLFVCNLTIIIPATHRLVRRWRGVTTQDTDDIPVRELGLFTWNSPRPTGETATQFDVELRMGQRDQHNGSLGSLHFAKPTDSGFESDKPASL